jgi:hypothetical protein
LYKDVPNVLFEPFNEPITSDGTKVGSEVVAKTTWTQIRPYFEAVTKAIRDQGAENIVICGTPFYSQYVNVAGRDQIKDASGNLYKNIAYAFHFYAASHGPEAYYVTKNKTGGLEADILAGGLGVIPIFVTEWGTTHSDGGEGGTNTYIDEANTKWWFDKYVNGKYHLSWCNWSVSDFQISSLWQGSTSTLSQSGKLVQSLLTSQTTDIYNDPSEDGLAGPALDTVFSMPGTLLTARYNSSFGGSFSAYTVPWAIRDQVDARSTTRSSLIVYGGITNEWVKYNINSTSATKNIFVRCYDTSSTGTGNIDVYLDNVKKSSISIVKNSGWTYAKALLDVPAGKHTIKFVLTSAPKDGYCIEWFELSNADGPSVAVVRSTKAQIAMKKEVVSIVKNGFVVTLPVGHKYTSYALIGVDGRSAKNGILVGSTPMIKFNDLPAGMWFVKLAGTEGIKNFKVVLNNRY